MKGLLSILVCVLVALCLGCAAKTAEKTEADVPDPHAGIFTEKCARCHDMARVEEAHETKTKLEKEEILRRMQQKPDSDISVEDLGVLIERY